jgi:uncharacterized membrane protein
MSKSKIAAIKWAFVFILSGIVGLLIFGLLVAAFVYGFKHDAEVMSYVITSFVFGVVAKTIIDRRW